MVFSPMLTGDQPQGIFSLSQISEILEELIDRNVSTWVSQQSIRAQAVRLYRDYYDGNHPEWMTDEMRRMLRANRPGIQFNDNYMPLIVQAEADRLILDGIKAEIEDDDPPPPKPKTPPPTALTPDSPDTEDDQDDADPAEDANEWAEKILRKSRFDALQADVHEAVLRDGDTFVMVAFDNDLQIPILKHELAYDGRSGIAVLYDSADSEQMLAAVKVWHTSNRRGSVGLGVRINIYLPGKIYKYAADAGGGTVLPLGTDDQVTDWATGIGDAAEPIGVPVVHFRNRGRHNYGYSELRDCISLQDTLNRMMYSMVINSELNAFGLLVATGFNPPADLTPGSIIVISTTPLMQGEVASLTRLAGGESAQYLDMSNWVIEQMHRITQTPSPEFMGSDAAASGEALKQREIGLIGKARRSQVKLGGSWERCMELAHDIDTAFGMDLPPDVDAWNAVWQDAELRNDATLVQNALAIEGKIDDETFLEIVSPVFDWNSTKISDIIDAKQSQSRNNLLAVTSAMPAFGNYKPPMSPSPGGAPIAGAANAPPVPAQPTAPQKPQPVQKTQ